MERGLERNKTAPCLRSTQELQEMDIHRGFWRWERVRLRKPWFTGSKKWLHQCWLHVKILTVNNCVLKLVLSLPPCRWHSLELRQWDGINGPNEVRNEWSGVSKSLKQEHNMGLPWWRSGWASVCQCRGPRVRALVWEDPTCRRATGPVSHNCWACASGACAPQRERPRWWEARAPRWGVAPACHN